MVKKLLALSGLSLMLCSCVSLNPAAEQVKVVEMDNLAAIEGCRFLGLVKGSSEDAVRNRAAGLRADAITVKQEHVGDLHYTTARAYRCQDEEERAVVASTTLESIESQPPAQQSVSSEIPPNHLKQQSQQQGQTAASTVQSYDDNQRKARICQSKGGEWVNQQCILHIE